MDTRIKDLDVRRAGLEALSHRATRGAALRCAASAVRHFFFLQFSAAACPGRIPVSSVDHPLDEKVPFEPRRVGVYLDFIAFWVRVVGFLFGRYGRKAVDDAAEYVDGMGRLYSAAARVYRKNMSTTRRPFYVKRPRFLLIHLSDPHLLCVPSLHVMIVVRAYTHLAEIARRRGDDLSAQVAELRRGAAEIVETVLYVKQHSVNCVPAAFYAMTRFDPALFGREEALDFADGLFRDCRLPGPEDAEAIRSHIKDSYLRLLAAGDSAASWEDPILDFLAACPPAPGPGGKERRR